MSSVKCESETVGDLRKYTMIWTVADFKTCISKTQMLKTEKPEFIDEIQLKIKYLGVDKDAIEIFYLSSNTVTMKSDLIDNISKRSIVSYDFRISQAHKWNYMTTLLINDKRQEKCIAVDEDDNIELEFRFAVSTAKNNKSILTQVQLARDLKEMLEDDVFCDVKLQSIEGEIFKAHKVVLASRSPVLKSYFQHDTLESQTNTVETPFEAGVLKEILTYIYSDEAPKLDEIPEKLLEAADYYQLYGLYDLCEEILPKKLSVYNAIETLQLAEKHNANTLKQLTLEFITHEAEFIVTTDEWCKFDSLILAKMLFERLVAHSLKTQAVK